MDLLQQNAVASIRPAPFGQAAVRAPRAVTPAGESFGSRLAEDRTPDDATPHGPPSSLAPPARSMYFSLLSDGTQDMLRQMFIRGMSYRIEDTAPFRSDAAPAPDAEAGAGAGSAPGGRARSFTFGSFAVGNDDQARDGSYPGLLRRATFAYTQGLSASPAFPFARPAETLNLVA